MNFTHYISKIISMGFHFSRIVKTRLRVLRAGFGSASADKFLSESVRILAERLTQSELVPRLSIVCHNPHLR